MVAINTIVGKPYVVYYGPELKKDGKPKKRGTKREVHQINVK